MAQVSWRASEELVKRVQTAAKQQGMSMNEYMSKVLDAATNPDLAEDDSARTRERLRRAGLLWEPTTRVAHPPDPELVKGAARKAGSAGPLAAELVSEGRGPR